MNLDPKKCSEFPPFCHVLSIRNVKYVIFHHLISTFINPYDESGGTDALTLSSKGLLDFKLMTSYLLIDILRGTVVTKAPLRVQFLPALGGEGVGKG